MKTTEEIIYELLKVKQYASEKNSNVNGEEEIERYSWIQDNIETFATAIELIKRLVVNGGELEENVLYNELNKVYTDYYRGGF